MSLLDAVEVVNGLLEQDDAALRGLMDLHGDYLMRTAVLLLKDRQAAEEAVQDTFVQAFYKIGQLKNPEKLRGWLTRIVVNRCRMKRRTWSWRSLLPFSRTDAEPFDGREAGPEELFLLEWRNASLSRAVQALDYVYREAVTLYYYNEMTVAEIAEQLGTSPGTIKARLSRGRIRLKSELAKGENLHAE